MNQVTLIRKTLQPDLGWHGAGVAFLALFLIALFRMRDWRKNYSPANSLVKTVKLVELATAFVGFGQTESNYKRLQRFLGEFELDYYTVAKLVVNLMNIPQAWVLSIDRSNWEFGGCNINILMLAVGHNGVAFPLLWWMLDKKGNSNTSERIDLLDELFAVFPEVEVAYLTADREFLGEDWFEYLLAPATLPFRIRMRKSDKLDDGQKRLKASVVFENLPISQHQVWRRQRRLWGHWVYVAALRLEDQSLLIVVTCHRLHRAIADSANRWAIETLFGCLKRRGFCLESTHLQDPERLSRMIALLTIALCWAQTGDGGWAGKISQSCLHHIEVASHQPLMMKTGLFSFRQFREWLATHKPIPIKKHGRTAKSIFRYGFDYLRTTLFNLEQHINEFFQVLQFLSCT